MAQSTPAFKRPEPVAVPSAAADEVCAGAQAEGRIGGDTRPAAPSRRAHRPASAKEAEVRADGNALGELGSRIVCETVIGLLKHDRNSYLNNRGGWTPADAVRLPNGDPVVTIRDFLRFAGVMG